MRTDDGRSKKRKKRQFIPQSVRLFNATLVTYEYTVRIKKESRDTKTQIVQKRRDAIDVTKLLGWCFVLAVRVYTLILNYPRAHIAHTYSFSVFVSQTIQFCPICYLIWPLVVQKHLSLRKSGSLFLLSYKSIYYIFFQYKHLKHIFVFWVRLCSCVCVRCFYCAYVFGKYKHQISSIDKYWSFISFFSCVSLSLCVSRDKKSQINEGWCE